MNVKRIILKEFRCFENLELEFNYHGKFPKGSGPRLDNVTLLLGNNGSGKSAVMKGLAWGALASIMSGSGLLPRMFVRRTQNMPTSKNASVEAHVILESQDGPESQTERNTEGVVQLVQNFEQWVSKAVTDLDSWQPIFNDQSPAFFVAAYGATRRAETSSTTDSTFDKPRSLRYQRVASIFEDQVALTSTSLALNRISNLGRLPEVVQILNPLLPGEVQLDPNAGKGEGEFNVNGTRLSSLDLSDGYRAFVAWTLDLLFHLSQVADSDTPLSKMCGLVLVDEIDLHLHPRWQRTVVESVACAFPNLQFIISSHSPLVAGSLESSNILLAERHPEGRVVFAHGSEHLHGLSADQILTSEYFGLATTRAVAMSSELHDLARKAWEGDTTASAEYLRKLAAGLEAEP